MRGIAACREGDAPIVELEVTPWASATFAGTVHRFGVELSGDVAATRLAEAVGAHEFALNGHIVADVGSMRQPLGDGRSRLEIEILTVED